MTALLQFLEVLPWDSNLAWEQPFLRSLPIDTHRAKSGVFAFSAGFFTLSNICMNWQLFLRNLWRVTHFAGWKCTALHLQR